MKAQYRMLVTLTLSVLAVTSVLSSCGNRTSVTQRSALTGASKSSFCSGVRTVKIGLAQRAKPSTDEMGLAVTFKEAEADIANAARLAPSSARPSLHRLEDSINQAIGQVITDGMGTNLDPFITEIETDLKTLGGQPYKT